MTAELGDYLSSLMTANDPALAMQAAVKHVSDALLCDISWTGLVDQDDQLRMGAHHGLRTPQMSATWHLTVGDGIGGRAASLARTQKSSNYLHDSRRVPAKHLIDDEEIATVVVTPLLDTEESVGVLYAAHRNLRAWSPHDIQMLESISHYLSLRLRQLGLSSQSDSTLQNYKRQVVAADSALRSSTDLIELLTNIDEIDSTIDVAATALNARVELHDQNGLTLYASGPGETTCRGARLSYELGPGSRLSIKLLSVDEHPSPADPPARLALNSLRLQLLRLSARETTREELRGDLLESLLTGRFADTGHLRRRLSLIGRPQLAEGAHVVVLESRIAQDRLSDRFHEDLLTTFPQSLVDHRGASVVIVIGGPGSEERLAQQVTELLSREESRRRTGQHMVSGAATPSFIAGIGRRSNLLYEISISYDEAQVACSIGRSDLRTGSKAVMSARALGLQGLASMPRSQLSATVQDTLGPILDHDERRGTHYMATVRSYLSNDRHLGNTAAELLVHYNTVRNRITRIEEMLNLRFGQADDRYRAETAVRMTSVLATLIDPPVRL